MIALHFIRLNVDIAISRRIIVRFNSWRVLFFGNDNFSKITLKALHTWLGPKNLLNTLAIVSSTQKSNPVLDFAQDKKLPIYSWPPDLNECSELYDIGVVVSFGHLIPKKIIDMFPLGMLNVHGSILPRWRGASPIIHAILNGDTETGVSIMKINPHHFDTGPVLLQKKCPIGPHELMPSVHDRLAVLGSECLIECLRQLPTCVEKSVPQNSQYITYAPRITPDISNIKWSEKTSLEVYNLYRALYGVMELKTKWESGKVKLKDISVYQNEQSISNTTNIAGSIIWIRSSRNLVVQCRIGFIQINALTFRGKGLTPVDFYNGYLSKMSSERWIFN